MTSTEGSTETCERLGSMVVRDDTDRAQRIAEEGLALRVLVGSGLHGTAIEGQDDQDEMGVVVESATATLGLRPFRRYIYRTQPEGHPTGAGDLDLTVYGLRRYLDLALAGNPTILLPLFVPAEYTYYCDEYGRALRDAAEWIVSRRAGRRFRGYLSAQRRGMRGLRSGTGGAGRREIVARYGFDAKYAMHMVRLGLQGVELMETGRITLPVPEPHLSWLRELRQGRRTQEEALDAADLEARLEVLETTSPLPPDPDRARVDAWLTEQYLRRWASSGGAER